jgi:hypothetical protein
MSFWNAFARRMSFYGEFGVFLSLLRTQWKETSALEENTERKMRDIRLMQGLLFDTFFAWIDSFQCCFAFQGAFLSGTHIFDYVWHVDQFVKLV